jgi:chemotaxis protein methyltransferase CheR
MMPQARMMESELSEREDREIDRLLDELYAICGTDLRGLARAPLKRRLRSVAAGEGARTLVELSERVLRDDRCRERLLTALASHDTSMFRDPGYHLALRRTVVPLLRTYPSINVWHPACSTGEQVYATAIVLREEGLADRARIYATDASDAVLARAAQGVYPLASLRAEAGRYHEGGGKSSLAEYYATGGAHGDRAVMRPLLRERICFFPHDLAGDASFNEFNLIICRDVLIYFGAPLHERVLGLLHGSLGRFGVLALGRAESLRLHPMKDCYQELDRTERLYRRMR